MKHTLIIRGTINEAVRLVKSQPYSQGDCLDLSNNNLHRVWTSEVCKILSSAPKLVTSMSLADNWFSLGEHKHLCTIIQNLPSHIESLSLEKNYLGSDTDVQLPGLIQATLFTNLKSLDLSNNELTDEQVKAIIPKLEQSELTSLNLDGNDISESTLSSVKDTLQLNLLRQLEKGRIKAAGLIRGKPGTFFLTIWENFPTHVYAESSSSKDSSPGF